MYKYRQSFRWSRAGITQSVKRLCTGWKAGGSNPGVGEFFRTRPDRPWGPPNLMYNGYRVSYPGVKWSGCCVVHRPPSSAEVKERVELYFYSHSGSSWSVLFHFLWVKYIQDSIRNLCIQISTLCNFLVAFTPWRWPHGMAETCRSNLYIWTNDVRRKQFTCACLLLGRCTILKPCILCALFIHWLHVTGHEVRWNSIPPEGSLPHSQ